MAFNLEQLREPVYRIIRPVTDWLVSGRVHPNALTTVGFAVTCSSAFFFHAHHVRIAGFLILLGGVFDILDGRVARLSGLGSKFGAFYDSTLDRISEIAVCFGLLSLYNDYRLDTGDVGMIYLIMLMMAGSLMISYTRARAESLGLDAEVGFAARAERVVMIGGSALFFGLNWNGLALKVVIFILAVVTNITAIQRILYVYRQGAGVPLTSAAPKPGVTARDAGVTSGSQATTEKSTSATA